MQQNEQELNAAFYKHFYNETLYSLSEESENTIGKTSVTEILQETNIPYTVWGENRKGLAIGVKLPEIQFQELSKNEFLVNILKAIQFSIPDVLFINIKKDEITAEDLADTVNFRFLLVFGENTLKTPFKSKYQSESIQSKTVILTDELAQIEVNTDLKKQLWTVLKQVFLT